jgi:hypothetical protein
MGVQGYFEEYFAQDDKEMRHLQRLYRVMSIDTGQ